MNHSVCDPIYKKDTYILHSVTIGICLLFESPDKKWLLEINMSYKSDAN